MCATAIVNGYVFLEMPSLMAMCFLKWHVPHAAPADQPPTASSSGPRRTRLTEQAAKDPHTVELHRSLAKGSHLAFHFVHSIHATHEAAKDDRVRVRGANSNCYRG